MRYKLYIFTMPFMFFTQEDLLVFLDVMFTNCLAKDKLYEAIIEWNTTLLYQSCFNESLTEDEQIRIFNTLTVLEETYGRIYDPEKILFSSVNKIKFN